MNAETTAPSYAEQFPLTPRQRQILRLIASHLLEHGRPPSYREMMQALGISSPHGMACHLEALQKKGLIEEIGGKVKSGKRGIRLVGARLALEYDESEAGQRLRELLASEGGEG